MAKLVERGVDSDALKIAWESAVHVLCDLTMTLSLLDLQMISYLLKMLILPYEGEKGSRSLRIVRNLLQIPFQCSIAR